jgi:hypothetical protein
VGLLPCLKSGRLLVAVLQPNSAWKSACILNPNIIGLQNTPNYTPTPVVRRSNPAGCSGRTAGKGNHTSPLTGECNNTYFRRKNREQAHHSYEIPIPSDFTSGGRKRLREIAIALAYTPVRSTRIKYRASRIDFRLVTAHNLEHVARMFNKATKKG